jgi:hypothetical protein
MKKGFVLIIGIFALGLMLICSMVVWKLNSITSLIEKKALESAAFYERNVFIGEKMLQTSAYVEKMFTVSEASDVGVLSTKVSEELLSIKSLLEELKSGQFYEILSKKIVTVQKHSDEPKPEESADVSKQSLEAPTVMALIDETLLDMAAAASAAKDVSKLAANKLELGGGWIPLKRNYRRICVKIWIL